MSSHSSHWEMDPRAPPEHRSFSWREKDLYCSLHPGHVDQGLQAKKILSEKRTSPGGNCTPGNQDVYNDPIKLCKSFFISTPTSQLKRCLFTMGEFQPEAHSCVSEQEKGGKSDLGSQIQPVILE